MRWQSVVIVLTSILGGTFLADFFMALRFRFPPGSFGRLFFFSDVVILGLMVLTGASLAAYAKGWKSWSKTERFYHGAFLIVPMLFWACFFGSAFLFAVGDPK